MGENEQSKLITIPRVPSKAPQGNTIEWEIPDKVLVSFMMISQNGYMVLIKVKRYKKHWWCGQWKNYSVREADSAVALLKALDILEKHSYYIDEKSIEFGEQIGDPEYFNSSLEFIEREFMKEDTVKKLKVKFIEYNPAELERRAEWLFWSLFTRLSSEIDNLKDLLSIDTSKWERLKSDVLFETTIWSMGNALAALRQKLNDTEKQKIMEKFIFFSNVMFPNYKSFYIIDAVSNYGYATLMNLDYKEMQGNLMSNFFERLEQITDFDAKQIEDGRIDLIVKMFPYGWVYALDAFATVPIKNIEKENLVARQKFRTVIINAQKRFKKGETKGEKKEKEKWVKHLDKFNELIEDVKSSLD